MFLLSKTNLRVDFHTHIIPEDFPDMAAKYGDDRWPTIIEHAIAVLKL